LANEIIKKNEKKPTMPEKKLNEPKKAAERARRIGIIFEFSLVFILWLRTNNLSITAKLSPLPEPYDPLVDPIMKEALDVMSVTNSIIDEVVDMLLNEAAEKILKED
jgi:hypothetical protein